MRLGMRRLVSFALMAQVCLTAITLTLFLIGLPPGIDFAVYVAWQTTVFFQAALTLGNLNALAMEPLGHIAGMAASVIASIGTVGSVILTVPVGLSFNGTPLPLLTGVLACVLGGTLLMRKLEKIEHYEG